MNLYSSTIGLRPVFHLRDTVQVTGGTGAEDDPYVLYAEPLPEASESESQVVNYADVDGNGTVDGIIYADLAVGGSGQWGNGDGTYTIPKGSNFKKYEVMQESYSGNFGTGQVIAPVSSSSGEKRFYVMALSDVDANSHCWYHSASGDMNDYATTTSTAFGQGEQNTINMITKWNNSEYGPQNGYSKYIDMWGVSAVNSRTWNGTNEWYVPSKDEWSAFANALGVTKSNYVSKGLAYCYWTSSQGTNSIVWIAHFEVGYMNRDVVTSTHLVRLGTTF